MSLTKEMVDLHGGKINVTSTKNLGTTFKVVLPISLENLPKTNNLSFTEVSSNEETNIDFIEINSFILH